MRLSNRTVCRNEESLVSKSENNTGNQHILKSNMIPQLRHKRKR